MRQNGTLVEAVNSTAALSALSTEGGETLEIVGVGFGPALPRSYVSAVWYGDTLANQYFLTYCTFTVAHTVLQCPTIAGKGAGFRLQVLSASSLFLTLDWR